MLDTLPRPDGDSPVYTVAVALLCLQWKVGDESLTLLVLSAVVCRNILYDLGG